MRALGEPAVLAALSLCAGAGMATLVGGIAVLRPRILGPRLLGFGLSFAAGAMVYIALVEILAKSTQGFYDTYAHAQQAAGAATAAFFAGLALMALLGRIIPHPEDEAMAGLPDSVPQAQLRRVGVFAAMAIIAHNIPEGMVTFFAALAEPAQGLPLVLAIALHNIPEGLAIAIPVYFATHRRRDALLLCLIAALAEPLGAVLGYLILQPWLSPFVFAILFGVIAGVMVYLALLELLPAAQKLASPRELAGGLIGGMAVIATSLVLMRPA